MKSLNKLAHRHVLSTNAELLIGEGREVGGSEQWYLWAALAALFYNFVCSHTELIWRLSKIRGGNFLNKYA